MEVKGIRALPPEIASETGFREGVFVTEEAHGNNQEQCSFVDEQGRKCDNDAYPYRNRIVGVVDNDGNKIKISEIDPVIRMTLETINQYVGLCLGHIVDGMDDDTIHQHVKRNDGAGKA